MTLHKAQSLLTKFFYCGNHLHFQILIQTGTDYIVYNEYSDYAAYKTAFDQIQQTLNNETKIVKLAEKTQILETAFANVA